MQEKSLRNKLVFLSEPPILLYSDYGKLRQVLINLLGNAIKFTEPEGKIEIRCINDDTGISIAIQDSGCGIADEMQQQIFEVFHQAESSGNISQKGTGLGLALVKSLMQLLGGSVSLKSDIGVGSTFTLHFHQKENRKS
jgi:signal transduction histidine kinase